MGRTLLIFALPVLASNILQALNGSINSIWVGRYLGPAALTATSNANIILFFLLASVFGVGMAGTILIGQAVGARNLDQAKRVLGTTAAFFAVVAIGVSVLGYFLAPRVLHGMHTPADAEVFAIAYLRTIFLALPSMYALAFMMVVLRGAGDSTTPFFFMAAIAVLDTVLNPLFIFGWGPVPRMGIAGAAMATLWAQSPSLAAFLIHPQIAVATSCACTACETPVSEAGPCHSARALAQGFAHGLANGGHDNLRHHDDQHGERLWLSTTAAWPAWPRRYGTSVQMPAFAIGAGISAMVAQCVGAKRWDRIPHVTWSGIILNLILTGTPAALILIFSASLLGLFLPRTTVLP